MNPERKSPLSWPAGWQRTHEPQHSRFDTSPERATRGLLAEIERLGGSLPVISSNAQYRQDGMPYARQGHISDTGVALHDNIHAITKTIEALRAIERHGASEMMDRAFTGFAALPAPGAARDWHDVLGLPEEPRITVGLVNHAYRTLAGRHHPDKGGSAEKMAEINWARAQALESIGGAA